MGGFARRTSYWSAFSKKYPSRTLLKLDAGSIFSRGTSTSTVVNKYMLEGTSRSGLDAINLSYWDLPAWQELGDMAAAGLLSREFMKIPLVSANVSTKIPSFPAIQRYILKPVQIDPTAGKPLRIAISGLLSDPEERISRKEFQVTKPQDAAREIMEELKGKADFVIFLTDLDLGQVISLAVVVPGINMIVVSHDYPAPTEAQQIGDSMVLGPINEARMISEVRFTIKSGAEKVGIESHTIGLDRTVPDDPVMAELIRRAQAEVDKAQK
jgi:2',3'-cyclic-nucleotide 2'-phosphodiesterase (5'-nucleotidase family)